MLIFDKFIYLLIFILNSNTFMMSINVIYRYEKLMIGALKQRYKRFLADISIADNPEHLTVHCPNTGSMLTLIPPHNMNPECVFSASNNLSRKYPHTLEYINLNSTWVGIHSGIDSMVHMFYVRN